MVPFLTGIAGPSCAGKSEVSRRLARIPRAPVVALDHYYKDLKHLPFEERAKTNFDAPGALDEKLVLDHVLRLKRGEAIEEPAYDFANHVRAASTARIEPAGLVILEGLFALYWPAVRELLNEKIYITAGHEICLERRIFRDVRERGRTEESVRAQYAVTVQPMGDEHVAPTCQYANVVLAGTGPVKQSVRRLLNDIADCMQDSARRAAIRQSLSVWLASTDSAEPAGATRVPDGIAR